ncbi:hypothetical protein E4U17_004667 [Claviceps sp. LM77 group G4]|nr:hypothetical protein E4U17_004667 [Claviceps sp. LM77 group G4]KAG6069465.1 hypothetical protein E4U33_004815 [Claviceps sp. LM78 group G4]KAG6072916.1 hypothetical protein E4U16_005009 [Claviceps sp. LM84 group G4]
MDSRDSSSIAVRRDASTRTQRPDSGPDRMAALKARVAAATGASKGKGLPSPAFAESSSKNITLKNGWESSERAQLLAHQETIRTLHTSIAPSSRGLECTRESFESRNPYTEEKGLVLSVGSRHRDSRPLVFHQKGKYIQQANAIRRQAALEAMKKRIAMQTRKAGINEDLDVEKNFVIDSPPNIEWWDEGLVHGTDYGGVETANELKLAGPESIITEYIQHPVALAPPQDRHIPEAKPMFLTSKEQAKIRRQRRMADLKEMQAKIRLGLVPAPPPKVKKGNLMRVLGDGKFFFAVKDPTAVEARVNREIAQRHQNHVQNNEARKLSKDQKAEKLAKNQQKDAGKGIRILVLKISSLANGQHRYKVGVNAAQMALSGTCIMHPKFNLVIVEGGSWSITKYKKLMLNRIDWTENSLPRNRENGSESDKEWLKAENSDGVLKDMSLNRCTLVFEGEQKARAFRKWSTKVCETDAEARDTLARVRMDNFWSLAKGFT